MVRYYRAPFRGVNHPWSFDREYMMCSCVAVLVRVVAFG